MFYLESPSLCPEKPERVYIGILGQYGVLGQWPAVFDKVVDPWALWFPSLISHEFSVCVLFVLFNNNIYRGFLRFNWFQKDLEK
jgi:hypothetical protein